MRPQRPGLIGRRLEGPGHAGIGSEQVQRPVARRAIPFAIHEDGPQQLIRHRDQRLGRGESSLCGVRA